MPPLTFQKIRYSELNGQQQEAYNFQKVSAILADFGYITIPLSNDWNGADFIAQAHDDTPFIKVQLKGRLTFDKKYTGKRLYICFRDGDHGPWYMYDHDELLKIIDAKSKITETGTWKAEKPYHYSTLSKEVKELLRPYRVPDEEDASRS